jgi:hypothetical protein
MYSSLIGAEFVNAERGGELAVRSVRERLISKAKPEIQGCGDVGLPFEIRLYYEPEILSTKVDRDYVVS